MIGAIYDLTAPIIALFGMEDKDQYHISVVIQL